MVIMFFNRPYLFSHRISTLIIQKAAKIARAAAATAEIYETPGRAAESLSVRPLK